MDSSPVMDIIPKLCDTPYNKLAPVKIKRMNIAGARESQGESL
jgi:hypothetical protein